jgi:hypothetical protein
MDNSPTPRKPAARAPKKKKFKSGRLRTANSRVKIVTTWPHEVVYDTNNYAAEFDLISLPLFVKGFAKVTCTKDLHNVTARLAVLEEVMEDAETHPWELVRSAHCVFLQQVETGTITWEDDAARQAIRRAHIHIPALASASATTSRKSRPPTRKVKSPRATFEYNPPGKVMAKAGDKVCADYNGKGCNKLKQHPERLHACQYCFTNESRICRHPLRMCKRKVLDEAADLNG